MKGFFILFLMMLGCTHKSEIKTTQAPVNQKPSWIAESDRTAKQFSKELAAIFPEAGSAIGFTEFDRKGVLIENDMDLKVRKLFIQWQQRLADQLKTTTDIEIKTDLEVLNNWLSNQVQLMDASRQEHEVAFTAGTKTVYLYLQTLINAQSPLQRKSDAVDRFKLYVRGDKTHRPYLLAIENQFNHDLNKYKNQKKFLPFQGEVENYLADTKSYVSEIENLLKQSGRTDWANDLATFKKQAARYDSFTKKVILKNSRKDFRIPEQIYAMILKTRGNDSSPKELIETGLNDYQKLFFDFKEQAQIVAKKNNLSVTDPAEVIQALKKIPVTEPNKVEELYHEADRRLEKIMRDNSLISVPTAPLRIRVASEAESKSVPVPHLVQPPLVENHGERPEFVVPSANKDALINDFSAAPSAMILTAHEGRPGHDMQFSRMLDQGVSIIRGTYAANNVNIEGWALYAEDLVFPYLSPEEKLFAYQMRLWRMARMHLDPQLQLGQIEDQKVIDVFTKELGVSERMANLELRRYKYDDIGQAPSYYKGYLLVKTMKAEAQARLKDKFNLKCFNDKLLSFGLLPLKISAERMKTEYSCN